MQHVVYQLRIVWLLIVLLHFSKAVATNEFIANEQRFGLLRNQALKSQGYFILNQYNLLLYIHY